MIKQISVFIENKKGRLAAMTRVLAQNSIDLISLSIADTADFGILRCIVSDVEKAVDVLKQGGFAVKVTNVIGVTVKDTPGGLSSMLEQLSDNLVSINYLYSFVKKDTNEALIIIKAENNEEAMNLLKDNSYTIIEGKEIGSK